MNLPLHAPATLVPVTLAPARKTRTSTPALVLPEWLQTCRVDRGTADSPGSTDLTNADDLIKSDDLISK